MVEVIWQNAALQDLDEIIAYIELHDEEAAKQVRERLLACGNSLSVFPERGRPAHEGRREMTTVPPYILSYAVTEEGVHILSIRHGRRRPLAR